MAIASIYSIEESDVGFMRGVAYIHIYIQSYYIYVYMCTCIYHIYVVTCSHDSDSGQFEHSFGPGTTSPRTSSIRSPSLRWPRVGLQDDFIAFLG